MKKSSHAAIATGTNALVASNCQQNYQWADAESWHLDTGKWNSHETKCRVIQFERAKASIGQRFLGAVCVRSDWMVGVLSC